MPDIPKGDTQMATTEFDWEGFRSLCTRLESLFTEQPDENGTFAGDCRRTLAYLYTAGVSMPDPGDVFEDAGGEEFWAGAVKLAAPDTDPAASEDAISALAARLLESIREAQPDELEEEVDNEILDAASRLWDVRIILAEGAALFDAERGHEAAWEWSFGFDDWGSSALLGMTALHDLLWGA